MVQGQSLFLAENRDFVQKVLDQPKGAQPPADKAPQQTWSWNWSRTARQKKNPSMAKGTWKPFWFSRACSAPKGQEATAPGQE